MGLPGGESDEGIRRRRIANAADRVRSTAWRSLSSECRREHALLAELDVRLLRDLRILVDGAPPLLS